MTRPHLTRRAVLRGAAGAVVALPLLEAMLDGRGRVIAHVNAAPQPVPRYLFLYAWPNGVDIDMMLPSETGPDYALGDCLAPLAAHKEDFVLVSNLRKSEAWIGQDIDNDAHARGHASWCTGHGLSAAGVGGPSVDQVAAEALWQQQTRLRSLVVALGPDTYFRGHVSWSAPDAPVPPIRSAVQLFEQLFPKDAPSPALGAARQGVLDFVREDAQRLRTRVGKADCDRMDQFFTALSEVEAKLNAGSVMCAKPDAPAEFDPNDLANLKADVMVRLMVLAMQCDQTRFAVFQLGSRWDKRQFPWLAIDNVEDGHHGISHDTSPAGRESYKKIIIDQYAQFAFLLDRMKEVQLPDGNLLEQSLIFTAPEHGSSFDDGHYMGGIPAILAGGAGGRLLGRGSHVRYESSTEYANILLTMLHIMGHPASSFGVKGDTVLTELFADV